MKQITFNARTALLAGAMLFSTATASFAGAQDYEFQAVQTEIKQGPGSTVSVRLVDKRTGKAVPDAVIFTTRMDMAPDGMETMTTTVEPIDLHGAGRLRLHDEPFHGRRMAFPGRRQGSRRA